MGTHFPSPKGEQPPQFSAHICCGKMAGWIKMPLGMEVGFGPGDCVRWGPSSPQKGAQPHIFDPCLLWPNGCMHQDTTLYGGRPQPRRHCVRWGLSCPRKGAQQPPPLLAHVYCGQTAGWIKIPLGTDVGLGLGDMLNADQPLPLLAHVCCGQTVPISATISPGISPGAAAP